MKKKGNYINSKVQNWHDAL